MENQVPHVGGPGPKITSPGNSPPDPAWPGPSSRADPRQEPGRLLEIPEKTWKFPVFPGPYEGLGPTSPF